jgi:U3 small nucleolar ribonucleoprotein protein LCP5
MRSELSADAELLGVLQEFSKKAKHVDASKVGALAAQLAEGELLTAGGIPYLDVKVQLLLSYNINLALLVLLKMGGRSIEEHEVVDALIKRRAVLEKIRPIDTKLRYEVDKLLRTAAVGNLQTSRDRRAPRSQAAASSSGLQFRPMVEHLDGGAGALEGGDGGAADELRAPTTTSDRGVKGGLYRPPRLASTPYSDEASKSRLKEDLRKKLSRNAMFQEMREVDSDRPTKIVERTSGSQRLDREEADRTRYEESNFIRLPDAKTFEKRRERARMQGVSSGSLASFSGVGQLRGLLAGENSVAMSKKKKKRKGGKKRKR